MTAIPILLAHDRTRPIGKLEMVDGKLLVKFTASVDITPEMFFAIFGDVGARFTHMTSSNGVMRIHEGEILEFSFNAP